MSRFLILAFFALVCIKKLPAQELYIQTEPASNMPKGTVGFRLTDKVVKQNDYVNTWLVPEVMFGITKNLMVHGALYSSDHPHTGLAVNGGYVYAKYRFYANDQVQQHFRLAIFGKVAGTNLYNSEDHNLHTGELYTADLEGYYKGYEAGFTATELYHKFALSASGSYTKIGDYTATWKPYSGNGWSYSLSAGYLLLPRHYTSYKQLNVNIYAEILGYYNTDIDAGNGLRVIPENHYTEVAPGVQFIINSQTRVDVSYRTRLYSYYPAQQSNYMVLLRLEHTIFNRW